MPRTRSPRPGRSREAWPSQAFIPDKLYFRIGEVSKLTHTKPYVLRFWESEFPALKPVKSKSGHRLYRRQDVELVLEIRRLLYEKGFTISGARQHLAHRSRNKAEQRHLFPAALEAAELHAIRHELQAILTILARQC
jgi:DNA-binding transcriptional MerR regulator